MNVMLQYIMGVRFPLLSGPFRAALLALALAGCASMPPEGAQEAALPKAPQTTGVETKQSREHEQLLQLFGGEYRAPGVETLLNGVLVKLAPASDMPGEPYRVTILNSPAVNAFALPSGDLYVTRGMLALANDVAEVAAVMAHEIAHVSARHAAQRAELERRSQLVGRVVTQVLDKPREGREVEAKAKLSLASFSRAQELEADRIGVRNVAAAGYDPYGAARFLAALGRSTALRAAAFGQQGQGERLDILATHPTSNERIGAALSAARQIGAPGFGEAGRGVWLSALDGLIYGDDPAQGFVRGRRFLHPRLGFSFTAPEGFVLENTSKALLGIAGGGAEAVRLDSVRVPATTSLEAYMASGWIEGLQVGSVETLSLNGLPAAIATAKGADWSFRFAAIRFGADVYRLIFATRSLTPEADSRFRESIDSFRRMSHEEVAGAKPLRIALVTAKPGATVESLSQGMAGSERPTDLFMLLNGLERDASLAPGERYKIVAE